MSRVPTSVAQPNVEPAAANRGQETLGHLLVKAGQIDRQQLHDALRLQRQNHRLLGTCLLSLGVIEGSVLLYYTSEQLGVPALPPGSLQWAASEAVQAVPRDMALRLRIVPYSFDSTTQMLGVAIADARVLEHLGEVAAYCGWAVGAYVALEMEIEAALGRLYGYAQVAPDLAEPATVLPGRPRPMLTEAHRSHRPEVPSKNFDTALGLKPPVLLRKIRAPTGDAPVQLRAPTGDVPVQLRAPTGDAPVRATLASRGRVAMLPLERISLYDAVERIYQVQTGDEVGAYVVRAFLNYFDRTMAFTLKNRRLTLVAYGGRDFTEPPARSAVALEAVPEVVSGLGRRKIAYGAAVDDPRAAEICDIFGLPNAATSIVAPVDSESQMRLLIYGDNGARAELYDDLHDIEMLLKEAETSLSMLFDQRG